MYPGLLFADRQALFICFITKLIPLIDTAQQNCEQKVLENV
jgi:hypothetical protein